MSNHSFNRRSNSCPDPWRSEAELHNDRPRSVLTQEEEINKSENSEFNKARVNQWIVPEVEDGAKSDDANPKKFYHYPQRRNAPGVVSEYAGTRPQTEPGRCRIGSSSTEGETLEDWVIVKKTSSDTMPCDPDDESNILVPSPNKTSTATCEQDSGSSERTRMVLVNKFGSAFEVLPRISDRTTGPERPKAEAEINNISSGRNKQNVTSVGKFGAFATSVMKWKRHKGTPETRLRERYNSLDPEHLEILQIESSAIRTEVPEDLMRSIKEEAYKIIIKTTQAYRSQIGGRHKLTCEAFENLKELKEDLQRARENN